MCQDRSGGGERGVGAPAQGSAELYPCRRTLIYPQSRSFRTYVQRSMRRRQASGCRGEAA
ncbi:hypothetical protein B0H17DRAFT_1054091 [Mycena rosella]|uniref:Uncharacterized protein n=1 Tax=Mycena rosella TaxID=1033263 RepID=A0AAD7GMM8_MYCRO|nr:hypothetical protein B0H17DRAFT_1054091 [Mycena rosella]